VVISISGRALPKVALNSSFIPARSRYILPSLLFGVNSRKYTTLSARRQGLGTSLFDSSVD